MTSDDRSTVRTTFPSIAWATFAALTLIKLWMIGGHEIVARYTPHDDLWYLNAAKHWQWLGGFAVGEFQTPPFIRPPGYPLFVALVHLSGAPLRLVIELCLAAAAFVFARVMASSCRSTLIGITFFALVLFHPASFYVNSYATTDSFYAPALILAVAATIAVLSRDVATLTWRHSIGSGIALALVSQVRQERIVVWAFLALCAGIALMNRRVERRLVVRRVAIAVGFPAAIVLVTSLGVNAFNEASFGGFAADALSMPGFMHASKALLRVAPERTIRDVPVTRAMRTRTYAISPAFKALEPYFEGAPGANWARFASELGVSDSGEIAASHFWWALNDAGLKTGKHASAASLDHYFDRIGSEIDAACIDHRLTCRRVIVPFVEPDTASYLPSLPASLGHVAALFTARYDVATERDDSAVDVRALFDEMANRRTTAVSTSRRTSLRGWAFNAGDEVVAVELLDADGRTVGRSTDLTSRPDVVAGYATQGIVAPASSGFQIISDSAVDEGVSLAFITRSGRKLTASANGTPLGPLEAYGTLRYAIDARTTSGAPAVEVAAVARDWIGTYYGRLTQLLTWIAGACAIGLAVARALSIKFAINNIAIAVIASAVITRVAFFVVMDASSFPTQSRYLYPVMGLYTCGLLLVIVTAGRVVRERLVGGSRSRHRP